MWLGTVNKVRVYHLHFFFLMLYWALQWMLSTGLGLSEHQVPVAQYKNFCVKCNLCFQIDTLLTFAWEAMHIFWLDTHIYVYSMVLWKTSILWDWWRPRRRAICYVRPQEVCERHSPLWGRSRKFFCCASHSLKAHLYLQKLKRYVCLGLGKWEPSNLPILPWLSLTLFLPK